MPSKEQLRRRVRQRRRPHGVDEERELEQQAASQETTMTGKTLPDLALLCAIMAFWNLQKLSFDKGTQCNVGS